MLASLFSILGPLVCFRMGRHDKKSIPDIRSVDNAMSFGCNKRRMLCQSVFIEVLPFNYQLSKVEPFVPSTPGFFSLNQIDRRQLYIQTSNATWAFVFVPIPCTDRLIVYVE